MRFSDGWTYKTLYLSCLEAKDTVQSLWETLVSTVAEGYNGFHARFSKFAGKIFRLRLHRSTFNRDSTFRYFSFHNAIVIFNAQLRFQLSTAIQSFNAQLRFQLSTAIQSFNAKLRFQLSTAIQIFNA